MPDNRKSQPRCALVVFGGDPQLAWLRVLKHGYRHCFAVLEDGRTAGQGAARFAPTWIIYNPLSHRTEISVLSGVGRESIAGYYRSLGYRVVETHVCHPLRRPVPWRPYTCVEAVKRVLGLRARWVFTPWQLSENLKISKNMKTILD